MRKFVLFFIAAIAVMQIKGQTLQLLLNDTTVLNYDDTVKVYGLPTDDELIAYIKIKNVSQSLANVVCKKTPITEPSGTKNTFCWGGLCYPVTTYLSTLSENINPGEVSIGYSGHFYPDSNISVCIIKYTFYVYHADSAYFYVRYDAGFNSVNENRLQYSFSAPFPNPSGTKVYFNYSVNSNSKVFLKIYNICGKLEKQVQLSSNQTFVSVDVSSLNQGIYFSSIEVNGKTVQTNKLIVKH